MRVTMRAQMSGTRDGKEWPARGEEIDLPDDEAAALCAQRMAEPVVDEPETETATTVDDSETTTAADETETATSKPPAEKRTRGKG